jgi:hypothetical protein
MGNREEDLGQRGEERSSRRKKPTFGSFMIQLDGFLVAP